MASGTPTKRRVGEPDPVCSRGQGAGRPPEHGAAERHRDKTRFYTPTIIGSGVFFASDNSSHPEAVTTARSSIRTPPTPGM